MRVVELEDRVEELGNLNERDSDEGGSEASSEGLLLSFVLSVSDVAMCSLVILGLLLVI
jgi:hypothetical protein